MSGPLEETSVEPFLCALGALALLEPAPTMHAAANTSMPMNTAWAGDRAGERTQTNPPLLCFGVSDSQLLPPYTLTRWDLLTLPGTRFGCWLQVLEIWGTE